MQLANAQYPNSDTELGMAIEVNLMQPWNAFSLKIVTEFGIETERNPLQPKKEYFPMDMIEFGILTEVNPSQNLMHGLRW